MQRTDFEHWKGKEVARLLALVETERRYYQEMLASLPVALVVLAADRSVVSANRAFRQMFSLSIEDLRRKSIEQILPDDRLIETIRDVAVNGIPQPGFLLQLEQTLLRISILPIRNWADEMEMETLLLVADVSDVRAGQATVTRAPAAVRAISYFPTEGLPAVIWRADASTLVFKQVSGAAENVLGYPAAHWIAASNFFAERIHPEDREPTLRFYRAAIELSGEASAEFRAISATGETIWCRETVHAAGPGTLLGVCTSITQRKHSEQRRFTAERISALRGLSARLAHELNNPLMIITGYAEEMLHGLGSDDPRRADAEQILEATLRIGGVTEQLLQFTRRQARAPQRVELTRMISEMEDQIVRAAGNAVTVDMNAETPVWASANRRQLEEILLALVSAEREDAKDRTRVSIACDTAIISELVETSSFPPLKPGKYARLTIHDNGRGMDAEKCLAVFESFLTKDPRAAQKNGSSVLARAYGVVREWGGDIGFHSELLDSPTRGSTFVVYLPLAAAESVTPAPKPVAVVEPPVPVPSAPKGESVRETILVVDDELGIRALVAKILRRERYLVLEAGSATEAVTVALIHGAPIHLLLTDVMLPDRSGRQVAEQLHEAVRDLKVVYMSGFTDDDSLRTGDFPPGSRFLQKPFTLGTLVGTVREALDQ